MELSNMAGREITRQSSFERMMSLVAATDLQGQQIGTSETERSKAAYDLQVWWAKERKILQTRKTIQGAMNHISTIAGSIDSIRSGTSDFGAVQKVLSASSFISSLTLFLSLLPLDPSLKAKNSSARSSHTIGSAFFIHYFRQEVLLDDEVVDQSRESNECAVGAAMLVRTLDRFISNCRTLTNPTAPISNAQFKQSMLSYRFSVRYFLEKLEQWKELDASRLLQSLEAPYTESYLIFVTLSKVLNISDSGSGTAISLINPSSADGGSDDTNMVIYRAAEHQCMKIRQAMLKLLGLRAQTRIEELNAQIEAAINARTQDDDAEDENADTPLQTAASSVQRESNQTGIQRVENVTSMPTSPIPNLEAPLSPRREFKDITTILTRIATAGGLQSTSGDSSNSSGSLEGDFLIGDDRHRLVHELALDPTYKLPDSPNPAQINLSFYSRYYLPSPPSSNIETGGWSHMIQSPSYPRSPIAINTTPPAPLDPVSGEAEVMEKIRDRMKSTMLFMMDDNIVSSLSRSSVPKESLKQIQVGTVIPVRYSNGQFGGMVLSSRVLAVNHEASTSESESDSSKERSDVVSLDVECLCDGVLEKNVPLGRVKISTDPPVPTPFLLSLQDTLNRIAGLTPHRADLHSELTAAVDFPLWMQMMTHSAMTARDISMIFTHVFSCIIKLQAPIRSEPFVQWTNEYLRLISACSTFESTVPLLPLLFEFTNSCIDEIRRDIANYHVATLSPLLRGPQGAAFLSQSIVRGLLSPLGPQEGASLDSTVSLLVFTIAPPQKRAEVMAEILEATGEVFDVDSLGRDATQESVILSLPNSAATATVTVAPTAAANSSSGSSTKVSANTAAVAVSVLRLLQLPIRLASSSARAQVLPETFLFDGQRLSALRDLIDIISVQCTVVITIRQALQKIGLLSSETEETLLYSRLDVLLRDPTVGMKSIITEAVRFVRVSKENAKVHIVPLPPSDSYSPNSPRALESHKKVVPTPASGSASQPVVSTVTGSGTVSTHVPPVPLSSEWEEALEKSLRNVLAEGNPVLLLFTKRVYKVLLRALLGQPYNAKLPSFSLHAKGIQKNLAELLGKATRLFSFHMSVYGEVYSMIFSSPTMQNYLFPIDVEVD